MKIFDCFSYWDEDLLLDLRLNILNDFVDFFVIVEGNKTWQNNPKEFRFELNNFAKFKEKIIYIKVEDLPDGDNPYLRENFQRNCISRGINNSSEDDLIMISDLDEIPNPQSISSFNKNMRYAVFKQKHFYYKINLQSQKNPFWYGSRICVLKYLKSPQWLRNIKTKKRPFWKFYKPKEPQLIFDGGWHFSFLKKPKDIASKIKSYSHQEFNKDDFTNEKQIAERIKNEQDLFNRNIKYKKIEIDESFPKYILENKTMFKEWII